jgi:hypothetical protein
MNMARTAKQGLGYFPFDIDFFQDLRIRKLIKYQGGKAITVYALLLCLIYRDGYYIRWDEELPFIISEQTGYDEAYIREVITCCLNIGLFSKELYKSEGVLTSKGIQVRYMNINRLCKRVATVTVYNLVSSAEVDETTDKTTDKDTTPKKKPAKRKPVKKLATPPLQPYEAYTLTIDEEIEALKRETGWLDQLQVLHHMDMDALRLRLDDFGLHCKADGLERHDGLADAKQHFNNWLRIVANKNDDNDKNRTKPNNRRQGNYLNADEKKTYGGTF